MKNKLFAFTLVAAFGLGGAVGAFALFVGNPVAERPPSALSARQPVWAEVPWPFPIDQWGRGKAFQCKAGDCGAEVKVYLRAKLASCNCEIGVADDAELDRMSDFELVGSEVVPLGEGRPIQVGHMQGRSRAYMLAARNAPGKVALSVAFNDRCDMVVATAVLPYDRPTMVEAAVMTFLNSRTVLGWAEVSLGL